MQTMPDCCYAPDDAEPAWKLYAAYNAAGDPEKAGLNYQGLPCPTWDQLPEAIRVKWRAVASASADSDILRVTM